ncbi:amidohydrolase [Jiangella ureilytica]|uniref:Amidohydrolase n=1 Tax=Jiangella ureilytica TaxID=2530374 RepID=A0A4R4RTY8_9ACTN|nr:amidohydrolase family protein [Jiangella ureilytica]TDC52779.1 amidohydrolase [Jiangella ureilytica]
MAVVDIHAHFVPPRLLTAIDGFELRKDSVWPEQLFHNGRPLGPVIPRLTELDLVLDDMDRTGVDVRVLCTASWLFCYWAEPDLGMRFARTANDALAEAVAAHPDRLAGLATVPLQDVPAAIDELRRAVGELGMRGVAVGTNINGRYFDDPELFPFLAAARELDVPVFFHPDNVAGEDRLGPYKLVQMIGNPHEATLSLVRLLLSGVLARLPGLKVSFPQAGGSIAYLTGRIDHAWQVRPEAHAHTDRPPSTFLAECHFDTITHSTVPLEILLRHVPPAQLLLGSDYPWDMGEAVPGRYVRELNLDPTDQAAVLGGNAARLLGL